MKRLREVNGINYFIPTLRKALHNITNLSLKALQCWEDYRVMEHYLTQRLSMEYRDKSAFEKREAFTVLFVYNQLTDALNSESLYFHERNAGSISGRPYPYSKGDVDRSSREFLDRVNLEVFGGNSQLRLKRCEIRNSGLGGLGVYATQEITAGQILYVDEPAIRGHLNATRRAQRPTMPTRCENCRQPLHHGVDNIRDNTGEETLDQIYNGSHPAVCACTFNDGEPIAFCTDSQTLSERNGGRKTCLEIARELYHFRTCGKNWKWLHDAMRLNWNKRTTEPPTHFTHSNELHGTILSLLLKEVIDITLLRREQTGNPHLLAHEIDELLPLQGEKEWESSRFPFTLAANIIVPFDILRHLGIDIFRDLTFDTWVIQIVLRKLLLSAVPWDNLRRGVGDDNMEVNDKDNMKRSNEDNVKINNKDRGKKIPDADEQKEMLKVGFGMEQCEPSFHGLYIFPGFAMFNHACHSKGKARENACHPRENGHPKENAAWAFDTVIPNRILVWAKTDIAKDEEISINYRRKKLENVDALRLLGCACQCHDCTFPANSDSKGQEASGQRGKRTADRNVLEGETGRSKRKHSTYNTLDS